MKSSIQVVTLWQRLTSTGLVLAFMALLTLLVLFGLVGASISHAHQGTVQPAVPRGGQMAPVTDPNDPTSSGTKPGSVGGGAVTEGAIHIGSSFTRDPLL